MQVLIYQTSGSDQTPCAAFDASLGICSSLLKYDGFEVNLVSCRRHEPEKLHKAIVQHRPQYILAVIYLQNHATVRKNLASIAETYPLPVLAVGPYATAKPGKAIAYPGVEALIVGEYERPAAAYLAAIRDGVEPEGIAGLWANRDGKLVKSPLGGLVRDLDDLPHPDRTLFQTTEQIQSSGVFAVKVARGCKHWCSYCINDWYHDLYREPDHFVRFRSVEDVVEEITCALATWPRIERIRIYDHALTSRPEWIQQLAEVWANTIDRPLTCHVRLEDLDQPTADALARCRCDRAHTQIASGSSFIRNEILSMDLSDQQIRSGCEMLAEAGIETTADIFVGCPYETEITIDQTLELLWSLPLAGVDVKIFQPSPSTRAEELSRDSGWITARSIRNAPERGPMLDMPSFPAGQISEVARALPGLIRRGPRRRARKALAKIVRKRR